MEPTPILPIWTEATGMGIQVTKIYKFKMPDQTLTKMGHELQQDRNLTLPVASVEAAPAAESVQPLIDHAALPYAVGFYGRLLELCLSAPLPLPSTSPLPEYGEK